MQPEPVPAAPAADQPQKTAPALELLDATYPKSPGVAATDVLEKFLAAKTLTERLTLIETQIPESELAKTCLMGA
ncbi:MAG: hypothetical protein ACRDBP_15865, partial [Luteolibacter sp.]